MLILNFVRNIRGGMTFQNLLLMSLQYRTTHHYQITFPPYRVQSYLPVHLLMFFRIHCLYKLACCIDCFQLLQNKKSVKH